MANFLPDGCIKTRGQTSRKLVRDGVRCVWPVFWWSNAGFWASPSASSPRRGHGQPQGQVRKPSSTCLLARSHARTSVILSFLRASWWVPGSESEGAGRGSQGKALLALAHLKVQCKWALHAGWRWRASREAWLAQGTVSMVIHLQEVSLAKVTGNHLKVCGGGGS